MGALRFCLVVVFLAYPLLSVSEEKKNADVIEQVSLPATEVAYRIKKWLTNSDLSVKQNKLKNGNIRIVGSSERKPTVEWFFELTPQSSLGTEVQVRIEGSDKIEDQVAQLFESIKYTGSAFQDSIHLPNHAIPEAVLNQIGNVACIHVQTKSKSVQFSGFFIDNDGLVLCTAHDLKEHENVKIMTNTGIYYEGNIIKTDFDRDLALIKVDASKEDIVAVTEGRNLLATGEQVFTIGCPVNLRGTIHKGFVSGPPRSLNESPLWQVQMETQPGSSGSPVFDRSGTFVGVVKGRHRSAEDVGFIVPLESIIDFLNEYFSL